MTDHSNFINTPRVEFIVKPARRDFKFRYDEKDRAGSVIFGEPTSPGKRAYPTIQIYSPYETTATVLVSCFTDDVNGKHMPHPHRIVRHPKCKDGVCVVHVKITGGYNTVIFKGIALQRTNAKDIINELKKKKAFIRKVGGECNPFKGESIKPSEFNMHSVRICFQVFLTHNGRLIELEPLISDPLVDYQVVSNLNILDMCPAEGRITGGTRIMLILKRLRKTDKISVIFVDKDYNEVPAIMEKSQPYILSNGCGVIICYSPQVSLEDSKGFQEFGVKVKQNDNETLSENVRCFVYRRILYPDSVFSEREYLQVIRNKTINNSLIADLDERMFVTRHTQITDQEVYPIPTIAHLPYNENLQNDSESIQKYDQHHIFGENPQIRNKISQHDILNISNWPSTSMQHLPQHLHNSFETVTEINPSNLIPSSDSQMELDVRQYYSFGDGITDSGVEHLCLQDPLVPANQPNIVTNNINSSLSQNTMEYLGWHDSDGNVNPWSSLYQE